MAFSHAAVAQTAAAQPEVLVVDAAAPAHPFPHFWEHMFGSGRASLSLRESYRQDLRQVKQVTEVEYVLFHAIFLDEMGVKNSVEADVLDLRHLLHLAQVLAIAFPQAQAG